MAVPLLEAAGAPKRLITDKAYDADRLRDWLRVRRTKAVIPSTASRTVPYKLDRTIYKKRNLIERLFCRLENWRRLATRYDRLARNFLSGLALVAVAAEWSYESLPSSTRRSRLHLLSRTEYSAPDVMFTRTKLLRLVVSFQALLGGIGAVQAEARHGQIAIAYVRQERSLPVPLSPLDVVAREAGLAGARLGIADNSTTGRFTGQSFGLSERILTAGEDPAAVAAEIAAGAARFVIADLDRPALARLTSAEGARGLTIINAGARDDELRGEECRANLLHTVPSRAMLADALAQYLMWKRWRRWFLVVGRKAGDRAYADAIRRAARKFGAEIVVEKEWTFQPGSGRADTGHVMLQTEVPAFTQVADYDALVVADEADEFGEYLIGRTSRPRPVVGTHGIVAAGWSPVAEQWGASQLQSRFSRVAGRPMNAVDYAAWAATRSIAEAAFRARSSDPEVIGTYLRGPDFLLAGFKGQGQSFRAWDGQMRQPVLIAGPRLLVSVSPQPGFLHRRSELDTLGLDREETQCRF